jgi:hypothetical protein
MILRFFTLRVGNDVDGGELSVESLVPSVASETLDATVLTVDMAGVEGTSLTELPLATESLVEDDGVGDSPSPVLAMMLDGEKLWLLISFSLSFSPVSWFPGFSASKAIFGAGVDRSGLFTIHWGPEMDSK